MNRILNLMNINPCYFAVNFYCLSKSELFKIFVSMVNAEGYPATELAVIVFLGITRACLSGVPKIKNFRKLHNETLLLLIAVVFYTYIVFQLTVLVVFSALNGDFFVRTIGELIEERFQNALIVWMAVLLFLVPAWMLLSGDFDEDKK